MDWIFKLLDVSLVTQCRAMAPDGIAGGDPGKPGVNSLIRAGSKSDESAEFMPSICHRLVQAGDVLIVETLGGGGYGSAPNAIGDVPPESGRCSQQRWQPYSSSSEAIRLLKSY
ncbi:MAG: hydantoinase B/oxoprolinase family protein [Planctomycetia bacterium]|nr:hydantoinase B/oxoprolinase family protein [Planctomycetia bacterium]MCC7314049.1 hydantoinase B/oxoprolinase family protein [Planctomycetota bacterium]